VTTETKVIGFDLQDIHVSASLSDGAAGEHLSGIILTGVPNGVSIAGASKQADGSWLIANAQGMNTGDLVLKVTVPVGTEPFDIKAQVHLLDDHGVVVKSDDASAHFGEATAVAHALASLLADDDLGGSLHESAAPVPHDPARPEAGDQGGAHGTTPAEAVTPGAGLHADARDSLPPAAPQPAEEGAAAARQPLQIADILEERTAQADVPLPAAPGGQARAADAKGIAAPASWEVPAVTEEQQKLAADLLVQGQGSALPH
jgi:hypothetical protein